MVKRISFRGSCGLKRLVKVELTQRFKRRNGQTYLNMFIVAVSSHHVYKWT